MSETSLPQSTATLRQARALAADDGQYLAGLLNGRLDALHDEPTITPVWTGPWSPRSGGRLTLAVVADLIDEATEQLLLASYATYPSPIVIRALGDAVARNVELITLLEDPVDNPAFTGPANPLGDLPTRRLTWPIARREAGASMHAKLLVVDRKVALVTSANVTGRGLERNLECGLLIRGGPLPAQLADHLLEASSLH